jgi:transcriptional regulator with PAS, ATPase and Fis domain
MKYLIMKRDMKIIRIIQGQMIKVGNAIKIINNIRIIALTNGDITKTMDFDKTT